MSENVQKEVLDSLKTILNNIDSLEKKMDKRFERLETSITMIGGDVGQLKQRVSNIEHHLEITNTNIGN